MGVKGVWSVMRAVFVVMLEESAQGGYVLMDIPFSSGLVIVLGVQWRDVKIAQMMLMFVVNAMMKMLMEDQDVSVKLDMN